MGFLTLHGSQHDCCLNGECHSTPNLHRHVVIIRTGYGRLQPASAVSPGSSALSSKATNFATSNYIPSILHASAYCSQFCSCSILFLFLLVLLWVDGVSLVSSQPKELHCREELHLKCTLVALLLDNPPEQLLSVPWVRQIPSLPRQEGAS